MKGKTIKKWIAGMMLPVTTLGAFAGVIAVDSAINTTQVSAASTNGNVVTFTNFTIDEYGDTWMKTETLNGTFGVGVYYADITFKNLPSDFVSIESIDARLVDYSGIRGVVESKNGKSARIKFTVNSIQNELGLYVYSLTYNSNSGTRTFCPEATPFESVKITFPAKDEKAPVLETQVFLTDVDNPMSLEYILSQVEFRDEVDGVLTPVVVKDNYSSNKNTVGKYTIEVKATDKAGNTGTGNIEVWVQDKTSPLITGKSTFTSNMSSPLTEAAIRSQLSANDNVDGNISNKIQVVTDGFTGNENKKGTYTIKYKVVDTAGNESAVYTVTVSAVDDVKPVISIKEGYSDTYTSSYKNTISLETIKASLVATDNVDGDIPFEIIEDKYSGSSSIPGTYTISFRSTDSAGNISEVKVITITVTDEIPPVFYASGLFIGVSQAQTLSQQDIVNILLYMEGLQNAGVSVRMESNEYMVDGINEPGVYRMSYRLVRPSGEVSEVQTAEIKVLGEKEVVENDEITQVTQRADNFGTKIVTALKNVGEFFIKLFKSIAWVFTFGHVDPKWNEWY